MKYEDIAIPILKSLKWPIISKLNSSVCISALCEIKLPLSITPQQFLYIKLSWSPYYPITPCTDLLMHYSLWIILYNFQVLSAFLYLLICVHSRPILTYLFHESRPIITNNYVIGYGMSELSRTVKNVSPVPLINEKNMSPMAA